MRHILALATLLVALCASASSHAATDASDPCVLLDWHDLQSMGVTAETLIDNTGWHQEEMPADLPGSRLYTVLCAAVVHSAKGRVAMSLNLSSVKGNITEEQFAAWLKSVAADDDRDNQKDVKEFTIGDAACESGRDELVFPSQFEGKADRVIVEYYVACDKRIGLLHLSMNAQAADGRQADLPTPAQVKALLDKSVARLKQTAFRTPN